MGNAFRAGLDHAAPHGRNVTVRDPKIEESGEGHSSKAKAERNFFYTKASEAEIWPHVRRRYLTSFAVSILNISQY